MTNPVEPLDEKALARATVAAASSTPLGHMHTARDSAERIIRAYMSALTVTSFPPAEQHDVTSHAVPSDGEGAVAWRWKEAETDPAWEFAPFRPMAPGLLVQPLFTHPAPVAAQPAEPISVRRLRGPLSKRATSAEFNEWDAREVVAYIDRLLASSPTPPTAPAVLSIEQLIKDLRMTARQFARDDPAPDSPAESYIEWRAADALAALSALPAQPNSSEGEPT